jgi:hypothetical protein
VADSVAKPPLSASSKRRVTSSCKKNITSSIKIKTKIKESALELFLYVRWLPSKNVYTRNFCFTNKKIFLDLHQAIFLNLPLQEHHC